MSDQIKHSFVYLLAGGMAVGCLAMAVDLFRPTGPAEKPAELSARPSKRIVSAREVEYRSELIERAKRQQEAVEAAQERKEAVAAAKQAQAQQMTLQQLAQNEKIEQMARDLAEMHQASDEAKRLADIRQQVLTHAGHMAVHSEKPWQTLIIVAEAYEEEGDVTAMKSVLGDAEKLAHNPVDADVASWAIRDVVKAMVKMRLDDESLKAIENISHPQARDLATLDVAVWYSNQGDTQLAKDLSKSISNELTKDKLLVSVAEGESEYEGLNRAALTINQITNAAQRDDAWGKVAMKLSRAGDFPAAESAINRMTNEVKRDRTLVTMARELAKNGRASRGMQMLMRMSNSAMIDAALCEISSDYARRHEFTTSEYFSERIASKGKRSAAISTLTIEKSKRGEVDEALASVDVIPEELVRERTLRSIAGVMARLNNPRRARNVARRIQSANERDLAFASVAAAAAVKGETSIAFNTIQEISLPHAKALALLALARSQYAAGHVQKATTLQEKVVSLLAEVESNAQRDQVLVGVARLLQFQHDSYVASDYCALISNVGLRDKMWSELAVTQIRQGNLAASQASAGQIVNEQLRNQCYDATAKVFAQQVKPESAIVKSRELETHRQRVVFLCEIAGKI